MAEFLLEIAGQVAHVTCLFESTPHQFSRYLTDRTPDFSVTVTPEDLVFEQRELDEEALLEGFKRRAFTDPFLERAAIQRKFAEHLFHRDVLLLHGSTVAVDGQAYLFAARSGTGKSTHTRLWRQVFGDRAVIVNDDKPFLQITGSGVWAYGSPWSGKHGLDSNICVPLKGICLLERGAENVIVPAAPEDMLDLLLHEAYLPLDPGQKERHLQLVTKLAQIVPLWRMTCNKDPEAARVAHAAMSVGMPPRAIRD